MRGPARRDPEFAPPAIPLTGTETALLVEDEPEVRRLVEKILSMQGYTVISAASPGGGHRALARPHERHRDPRDRRHHAGNETAGELARVLATARPTLRVLAMSGYTDAVIAQQGVLEPGTAFLSKPFTPDALARKIREVLDAPSRT